jgi:hypothetical protein
MAQILLSTTQEKFLGILDIPLFYEVNNTIVESGVKQHDPNPSAR